MSILAAGLAHELRNAATGCRMAVDLHREDCSMPSESLDVARQQLVLIEQNLQRLLLFRTQRSLEKKNGNESGDYDLADVVTESVKLILPMARHAAIDLRWLPPNEIVTVSGREHLMLQACTNLLANAIEAARANQVRSSVTGSVSVDLNARQASVSLIVRDSGTGPQATDNNSIFDPLVTSKPEGLGLGLAFAQQVVLQHGGTIDWCRRDNMTEFEVCLPAVVSGPIESEAYA